MQLPEPRQQQRKLFPVQIWQHTCTRKKEKENMGNKVIFMQSVAPLFILPQHTLSRPQDPSLKTHHVVVCVAVAASRSTQGSVSQFIVAVFRSCSEAKSLRQAGLATKIHSSTLWGREEIYTKDPGGPGVHLGGGRGSRLDWCGRNFKFELSSAKG